MNMPMYSNVNIANPSILKNGFLSRINWSSLLTNTQKTLNVVNQAIPLYYQVKPIFSNIKSINKIAKEFTNNTAHVDVQNKNEASKTSNPTFFI